MRHGEDVKGPQVRELPSHLACRRDIPRERGRIAGDVGNSPWTQLKRASHDVAARTGTRGIEDDDVAAPDGSLSQPAIDALMMKVNGGFVMQRTPCPLDCHLVGLDSIYAAARPHVCGVGTRKEPDPGVEIDNMVAESWLNE